MRRKTLEYVKSRKGFQVYECVATHELYLLRANYRLPNVITFTDGKIDVPDMSFLCIFYLGITSIPCILMNYLITDRYLKYVVTVLLMLFIIFYVIPLLCSNWNLYRNISTIQSLFDVNSGDCNRLSRIEYISRSLHKSVNAVTLLHCIPNDVSDEYFDGYIESLIKSVFI